MRKTLTIVALFVFIAFSATAQQDAMFTKYMFNSLVYNPAYAGSKDHLAVGLLHRTQWWGIDGAPNTQSFTIHTPLRSDRVGVGLSAVNDVIGPTNSIGANISYAYRIPMGKGKLAIGLQGGVMNWRADWSELNLQTETGDEAFDEVQPSYWLPNFGAGIYYYSKYFYVGVAAPHLVEYDLRQNVQDVGIWAKTYRHYFGTIGAAIPVGGESFIFKPSLLVKNVGLFSTFRKDVNFQDIGAPTEVDIDLSMLFYQSFWFGVSFRTAIEAFDDTSSYDSIDFWASYYMANGLRIGAAYDFTLTKLQQPGQGSFEVMLGYEFNYKTKKAVTPRYF